MQINEFKEGEGREREKLVAQEGLIFLSG